MASFHETDAGYTIHWRYRGRQFNQSAGKVSADDARLIASRIDVTINAINQGWKSLPPQADYATIKRFIFSGGTNTEKETIAAPRKVLILEELFAAYRASGSSNEANTLYTEQVHQNHLVRILGASKPVEALSFADIQGYADTRRKGYARYRAVGRETVKKELKTLGKIWNWALGMEKMSRPVPWHGRLKKLDLGKAKKREKFRTLGEIRALIAEGHLSDIEQDELWACLYLRGEEVAELLAYVKEQASAPFVYPMFTLCALTGCRRGEAQRSLRRDINFDRGLITLRAKKRDETQEETLRDVALHPRLAETLTRWFQEAPKSKYVICDEGGKPISIRSGRFEREFANTLKGSDWEKMKGWHCLRHSFASILASKGIDQRIINKFMDHLDDKTVARYQHLYEETGESAVLTLLDPLEG